MSEPHAVALESGNHNSGRGVANDSLVEMALAVAQQWPVFPCNANKRPITERGFKDASRDAAAIRKAFRDPRAKLIGVPTGAETFDVLDFDPRHGSNGWRETNIHRMSKTRVHGTAGGGEHWLFSHADGVRNQAGKIAPGLDIRGEGGYCIVPPSAGYTIISDAEIAPWPDWLLPLALKPQKPPRRPAFTPARATGLLDRRYQGFVLKLLDNVRAAPEGAKHDVLLRQARTLGGVMLAAGITENDAVGHLLAALPNTVRNWQGAAKTALDGLRHGAAEPIELEDRPGPAPRKTKGNGLHRPQADEGPETKGNGPTPPPPPPPEDDEIPPPEEDPQYDPEAVEAVINRFNAKFMVVNENGKAVVYQPGYDPVLKRRSYDRLTTRDLLTLYMNEFVRTEDDDEKPKTVAQVWLRHKRRRQYIEGVVFDPSMQLQLQPGVLNLWEGFAVKPAPGDWSIMRDHIRTVLCADNENYYDYLIRWIARLFQHPAEHGEVAVVMKGDEGTGKGTLAKVLMHIIGQHGIAISNAKHLVGNFNSHLRDAVFLFADEAFFAGDRAHVGVLKSLITEPYLTIEAKFANAVLTPNFLHVMMASNNDWVVPASLQSRRFFVLDVSALVQKNFTYFASIWKQMAGGGYEAMLHDLLAIDLTTFDIRDVPTTEGLQQQRKLSLPMPESWWLDVLHRGYVFQSKLGLEEVFSEWHEEVTTELLYASYTAFADRVRDRHQMSRETFGTFMIRMGCKPHRPRNAIAGEHITDVENGYGGTTRKAEVVRKPRAHGYSVGLLYPAREAFTEETGLAVDWSDLDA